MTLSGRLNRLLRRSRTAIGPRLAPATARVPACRCAGLCRCGSLVPALLLRQIERECEFYRQVM